MLRPLRIARIPAARTPAGGREAPSSGPAGVAGVAGSGSAAVVDASPTRIAARWPADRPLLLLGSGRPHPRWSRWSILAEPREWITVREGGDFTAVGQSERVGSANGDALALLGQALRRTRRPGVLERDDESTTLEKLAAAELPFLGGWVGVLGYELGRTLEPSVCATASGAGDRRSARRPDGHEWPILCFAHCPRALVHDRASDAWWSIGPADEPPLEGELLARVPGAAAPRGAWSRGAWSLASLEETTTAPTWRAGVERTVEYIRAGDIYQANIAHLLRSALHVGPAGSPRAMALHALEEAQPWHGALLELPDGSTIVSLSPELFLAGELGAAGRGGGDAGCSDGAGDARRAEGIADGYVVTRPIKGTRPERGDPAELMRSDKDDAELTMIVDLMRNDLGRICRPGTVEVSEPRHVERHPTVHQAVATVQGRLRGDVDAEALLRATFPPGSVTGAPKIRAMQIIESIEPFARGPYCGAIGYFSDHGRFGLNVAIRTLAIAPPRGDGGTRDVLYGVGCGIVADSDPAAEWRESMDKAEVVGVVREGGGAGSQDTGVRT